MGLFKKAWKVVKGVAPILAPPPALVALALAEGMNPPRRNEKEELFMDTHAGLTPDDLFDQLDAPTAKAEGGYVFDKDDPGGETNHGITIAVAREEGYTGRMVDMTAAQAKAIRKGKYWIGTGIYRLASGSPAIAREVYDTSINMGLKVGPRFLQRALNALNRGGTTYPDIQVDGAIGNQTMDAFMTFIRQPGAESVMLKALNGQQTVRYMELAEANKGLEKYENGWIAQRVD